MPLALFIGACCASLALVACGDSSKTTATVTQTVTDTSEAGGESAAISENEHSAASSPDEFCNSDEAVALQIADKKMMDLSYGQITTSAGPDPAKVQPFFDAVLQSASEAPVGATCVAQPLYDAEGVAKSGYVPDSTTQLQQVLKEIQRQGLG